MLTSRSKLLAAVFGVAIPWAPVAEIFLEIDGDRLWRGRVGGF